ncbi:DUF5008 domain-containing protein [Paraflavitalea pollutisoli]|uniref:DUF5008 domain-containing protein n=1 Tax=Paraflavitalea pollutisoli TaxID=3034143 RepID=UPI0023EC44F5|nr:DUF5008 domain-containing protein [Paraflavitalea sp. H1-2-19X]
MKMVHQLYIKRNYWMGVLAILLLAACKKDDENRVQLYPEGPKADIKFLDGLPSPSQGRTGAIVTFKVKGLKDKASKFKFLLGEMEAEVITVADSAVSVRIPADAITGGAAIVYENQYYFGPEFRVRGNLIIDPSFVGYNGANGTIYDVIGATNEAGSYVIAGSFADYNNLGTPASPVYDIAKIDKTGTLSSTNKFLTRSGASGGTIYSLSRLSSGNYLAAGFFTKYNDRAGISSITRLYQRAQLDSTIVTVVNPDPVNQPNDGKDTVATFNGGVNGVITYAYETANGQIIAAGSFTQYNSIYYTRSTKTNKVYNRVITNQVVKMNADGSLDSSFNYDLTLHRGKPGANGPLTGALRIANNRLLLFGAFTTWNGQPANHVVCLEESDGSISTGFNMGLGADGLVKSATYNEKTGKIILTGDFKHFNGIAANMVVMLKADGSVDLGFEAKPITGGKVNYAAQLNSGDVIIAGSFERYDGKVRPGFAYLTSSGLAVPENNTTGTFSGTIYKMIERTTDLGYPGVILVGEFRKFDNTDVNNIVFLEIRK